MLDLDTLFAEHGALARAIRAFRARPFQLEMARAVAAAIERNQVLIAEAGTGTGKTFAYLVPALLSGAKVIISTGTKTLQDQLFDRDIPTVRNALKVPVTVALLKGRANYVCHYHLERARLDGRFASREDARHVSLIESFARMSPTGDKADCASVPETAPVWSYVTSTRDNCLGSECPDYDRCFVMAARRQALAADVVVVNHHLFFADLVLRDEGAGELLPTCNTIIFDEAHQLPETASLFLGESVSTSQYLELARDVRVEAAVSAKECRELPEAAHALDKAARDLRLAFHEDSGRLPLRILEKHRDFAPALDTVLTRLDELAHGLAGQAQRSEGLERCWQRTLTLAEQTERWRTGADASRVRWGELFSRALHLNSTPLSIASTFRDQIASHPRAWIFTSATLSVGGDFSHYSGELGLDGGRRMSWDSPFDYERQALLYVPQGIPEPNTQEHTPAVVTVSLPLIEACGGRAFLLFTSLRAMREAHALLREAFAKRRLDFPLLAQGEGSRTELLERFRELGNAVLVGSQSFWEGVDVRGDALSLVVIDKLPFAAPDDPVLAARIDMLNREGRNAFLEYQLPQAVITLKQGAGRLIRDENDRGVLAICDTRLVSRGYGRRIVQSLPRMKYTRDANEAVGFLAATSGPAMPVRKAISE
ncbi:MAG TPA: ATP-dependent DNA helicase [Burkholderiales bacterium]|nr:ATP-dependent DNA helicase [Burkholderiales bacterium]